RHGVGRTEIAGCRRALVYRGCRDVVGCSRRWLGCSLGVTRASRVGRRQHRLQVGQQWAGSLESGEYVELLTCFVELSRANQAIHESRLSAAQASLTSDGYFESRDDRTPVGVRVAHV